MSFCTVRHKMAFVSGPRQCGKTTLGHMLAKERDISEYYNWDNIQFRRQWSKSPESIIPVHRNYH